MSKASELISMMEEVDINDELKSNKVMNEIRKCVFDIFNKIPDKKFKEKLKPIMTKSLNILENFFDTNTY